MPSAVPTPSLSLSRRVETEFARRRRPRKMDWACNCCSCDCATEAMSPREGLRPREFLRRSAGDVPVPIPVPGRSFGGEDSEPGKGFLKTRPSASAAGVVAAVVFVAPELVPGRRGVRGPVEEPKMEEKLKEDDDGVGGGGIEGGGPMLPFKLAPKPPVCMMGPSPASLDVGAAPRGSRVRPPPKF